MPGWASTGQQREPDADVLFASIQTLGRVAHLERFPRDGFAIDHFRPKFLL